jgi:putative membrane protein
MTITTIGMLGTWIFGVAMLVALPAFLKMHWLHAKLLLVLGLSGYHGWLKGRVRAFALAQNTRSARYYRILNEVPALLLVAIVLLVVLKPF